MEKKKTFTRKELLEKKVKLARSLTKNPTYIQYEKENDEITKLNMRDYFIEQASDLVPTIEEITADDKSTITEKVIQENIQTIANNLAEDNGIYRMSPRKMGFENSNTIIKCIIRGAYFDSQEWSLENSYLVDQIVIKNNYDCYRNQRVGPQFRVYIHTKQANEFDQAILRFHWINLVPDSENQMCIIDNRRRQIRECISIIPTNDEPLDEFHAVILPLYTGQDSNGNEFKYFNLSFVARLNSIIFKWVDVEFF